MFHDLRLRYPNAVIVTATQIPRNNTGVIQERIKNSHPDIIIVDYLGMVKPNNYEDDGN